MFDYYVKAKKLYLSVQINSYIFHIMCFKVVRTVVGMDSHGILKMFLARKKMFMAFKMK